MKICLFGGTFDPPHIGHLLVAQTVCEAENFDKILFMPAYSPAHKNGITSIHHRINMVKIAIKDNPKFEYSDVDVLRKGTSYSIDSIIDIKKKLKVNKKSLDTSLKNDSKRIFNEFSKCL